MVAQRAHRGGGGYSFGKSRFMGPWAWFSRVPGQGVRVCHWGCRRLGGPLGQSSHLPPKYFFQVGKQRVALLSRGPGLRARTRWPTGCGPGPLWEVPRSFAHAWLNAWLPARIWRAYSVATAIPFRVGCRKRLPYRRSRYTSSS